MTPKKREGVRLRDLKERAPRLCHVHHSTDKWEITSSSRLGDNLLTDTILNISYPGELGTYILPDDSVFTLKDKKRTTIVDWEEALFQCREASSVEYSNLMFNFLTVNEKEGEDSQDESECPTSVDGFESEQGESSTSEGEDYQKEDEKEKLPSDISDSDSD